MSLFDSDDRKRLMNDLRDLRSCPHLAKCPEAAKHLAAVDTLLDYFRTAEAEKHRPSGSADPLPPHLFERYLCSGNTGSGPVCGTCHLAGTAGCDG